jgi:hypothetical protein
MQTREIKIFYLI